MADQTPDGPPGWTLGAIRKHGMRLEAACKTAGCGQFVVFDLERLITQLGTDYPLPETGPGMTCERCGAEMKFQLAVWHSDHDSDHNGTGR
jgi:hypothetical protein